MAKAKPQRKRKFKESGQSIISDEIDIPNHSGMLDAGTVHRTPTDELDPVNKAYVDAQATKSDIELFLTNNASDIATYKDLEIDVITAAEETIVQAITANSTTLIASFASILNEDEIDALELLESGVYGIHLHASTDFLRNMTFYFEFYHRTAGGTETLLGTSHDSGVLTTSAAQYETHSTITTDTAFVAGDRIVVKVYGRNGNATAKNITINMEGTTASRVMFPAFIAPGFVPAHTIVSHDTTATGANLTSLTDNSMADTLHRHSELSASDGSPDAVVIVDASGRVRISTDLIVDTDLLFVDIAGNVGVGIGTATPSEMLDVVGNAEINGDIIVTGTVDGIDIATDVAANTLKISYTDAADVTLNTADRHGVNDVNSSSEPVKGADDNYVTDAEKIVIGNTSGTNTGDVVISDIAYNAGTWDANLDGASKNAIRDKIESLPGGHNAVTLNANATAAGLSLSTQEINYRASTNAQTGYATAAQVTAQEANTAASHAESHTVASHNDTTGTGAELNTLTDNSMADALHRHSELSASDGTPDQALVVDAAGNVGIGTASPDGIFHVTTGGDTNMFFDTTLAAGDVKFLMGSGAEGTIDASIIYDGGSDILKFSNQGQTANMVIDNAGKVGIGTTNPKTTLQLGATGSLFNYGTGAAEGFIVARNVYTDNDGATFKRIVADNDASMMEFGIAGQIAFWNATDAGTTADSEITFGFGLFIQGDGDVGIGTSTPAAKLDVAGDILADGFRTKSFSFSHGHATGIKILTISGLYTGTININKQRHSSSAYHLQGQFAVTSHGSNIPIVTTQYYLPGSNWTYAVTTPSNGNTVVTFANPSNSGTVTTTFTGQGDPTFVLT